MSTNTTQDIASNQDIKQMVDSFYDRVRNDNLIGPIFIEKIENNWQAHLDKMYTFWQSVLFHDGSYNGRPFPPHAAMQLKTEHFERWLLLFNQNIDSLFAGKNCELAKNRALNMALVFATKIKALEGSQRIPLI